MFDKLRKLVANKASEIQRHAGLPTDLHAVPAVYGRSFGDLDPGTLSAYLGCNVESVEPMGGLGPEATSFLGGKIQQKLREAAAGQPLQPGELIPGQFAAIEARLRAEGADDDMIATIRARMSHEHQTHRGDGWDVEFADGHRASVQLFALGTDEAAAFDQLEHQWDRENGTDGQRAQDTPLLMATVQRSTQGPYETYCLKGKLAAKGQAHVAIVQSGHVANPVMIGLATVALRCVEAA